MKKTLLLFLLLPLLVSAKFYKASITLTDSTTKNGYLELPENPDDANIKFKADLKAKVEKLGAETVISFEITTDDNKQVKFITINLAEAGVLNHKKITVSKKKSWVRIVKEGKISLYAAHVAYNPANKTGGAGVFYIKREHNDYALYLDDFADGGVNLP